MTVKSSLIEQDAVVAPGVSMAPPSGFFAPFSQSLWSTTAPASWRMHSVKPFESASVLPQSAAPPPPPPPPEVASRMLTTPITSTATTAVAMYQPRLDERAGVGGEGWGANAGCGPPTIAGTGVGVLGGPSGGPDGPGGGPCT